MNTTSRQPSWVEILEEKVVEVSVLHLQEYLNQRTLRIISDTVSLHDIMVENGRLWM
jgi:hypothetical protein